MVVHWICVAKYHIFWFFTHLCCVCISWWFLHAYFSVYVQLVFNTVMVERKCICHLQPYNPAYTASKKIPYLGKRVFTPYPADNNTSICMLITLHSNVWMWLRIPKYLVSTLNSFTTNTLLYLKCIHDQKTLNVFYLLNYRSKWRYKWRCFLTNALELFMLDQSS